MHDEVLLNLKKEKRSRCKAKIMDHSCLPNNDD